MAVNRGKQFEEVIKKAFLEVQDVSIDRLHDPTAGYAGIKNICDFVVYKKPYEYYIECKSVHGNLLPFTNITKNQWQGLLDKSKIYGVYAGVICWWIDKDITAFIPIAMLESLKKAGFKSIRYDTDLSIILKGKKKRVFFEYDMKQFFKEVEDGNNI